MVCLLYPARRLTCQPRDWGWQCPLLSSDYNSAGKATVVFGTCWSLICSTALYTEMKNIWSAHTLCLDWLHKCMRLCNPDLRSYFSLFWSISYFVFNHIRQPAGWFPGGLSQMASLAAWPSAQVSLPPPHCFPCVFPASLPMKPSSGSLCQHTSCGSWWSSWSARRLFRQCVELACSLCSSYLTVWAFQQAGQSW